jgi:hypothetical protein
LSIGQRLEAEELSDTSLYELYSILGERDTPYLFDQGFKLDTEHDWPTGGGNTTDRRVVGIDRTLYQQVMDNEFKASGLEPMQIINGWIQHEHIEICIVDGDNPVDSYWPSHRRALRREHEFYRFLGCDVHKIEKVYWPGLQACYKRPVRKAHPLMWCGPLIDNATEHDEEILAQLQKLGVKDAFKRSKYDAHYGLGGRLCSDCLNYGGKREIEPCRILAGQVRANRSCDFWQDQAVVAMARQDDIEKLQHDAVSYGKGRDGEFCRNCKYSDHKAAPKCALVTDIEPMGWCRLWSAYKSSDVEKNP